MSTLHARHFSPLDEAEFVETLKKILADALEQPAADRDRFLQSPCSEPELYERLKVMLGAASSTTLSLTDGTPLANGSALGGHVVQSLIGRGGMGEVYRARDPELARDVAIEILPQAYPSDRDRRARFEREAMLLASLSHPNIAAVYGPERHGDITALVLEAHGVERMFSLAVQSGRLAQSRTSQCCARTMCAPGSSMSSYWRCCHISPSQCVRWSRSRESQGGGSTAKYCRGNGGRLI